MIDFYIYHILVSKCKHGIGPIYVVTFNEELEYLSTSIIKLINIYESLHEKSIVIFITKKNLKMPITIMLQRMTIEIALNYSILKILYKMILINLYSCGGWLIHISIQKKLKLVILKL